MITPIHVLLKDDPCLEGDVADDKADPLVCLQLNQISVLHYFFNRLAPWTTNMCLDRLFIRSSCNSGCIYLENREGWRVAGDLVHQEAPDHS